jgi:hypothetical protein
MAYKILIISVGKFFPEYLLVDKTFRKEDFLIINAGKTEMRPEKCLGIDVLNVNLDKSLGFVDYGPKYAELSTHAWLAGNGRKIVSGLDHFGIIHYDHELTFTEPHKFTCSCVHQLLEQSLYQNTVLNQSLLMFGACSFRKIFSQRYVMDRHAPEIFKPYTFEHDSGLPYTKEHGFLRNVMFGVQDILESETGIYVPFESLNLDNHYLTTNAFFAPADMALSFCDVIRKVIESGKLNPYTKNPTRRAPAHYLERCLFLFSSTITSRIEMLLTHHLIDTTLECHKEEDIVFHKR